MVQDPEPWIEDNIDKVDTVLVHLESNYTSKQIINWVKNRGKRFGFVLNPETSLDKLSEFTDDLDQVLIMTVNPGFYGSPFLPEMLKKIQKLRSMNPKLDIEVDGGITEKTIQIVDQAGANMFVSGSYIVKAEDVMQAINKLKKKIKE
jgi:ribulose-phosphate 3-epimerase